MFLNFLIAFHKPMRRQFSIKTIRSAVLLLSPLNLQFTISVKAEKSPEIISSKTHPERYSISSEFMLLLRVKTIL